MNKFIENIDRINAFVGKSVSWLSLILVAIIIADVTLRYALGVTSSASFELEWHLFACLFLLSAGWTLQQDKHVRVDVFYQNFSAEKKAWVNLIGCSFLLIPFCLVGIVEGFQFSANAYHLKETSPDPGGLPARFIVKAAMPAGFFLLGLQAFAEVLRNIKIILKKA
ncbi:MAG: TRAP transporter small permease subunit [Cyclobacteriaceae bacterium]